jgi:hypothetical protein
VSARGGRAGRRLAQRSGRPLAGLALAAWAALLPGQAAAQEVRYTRPLDVQSAGWVRAPLGPEVLRQAGAGTSIRLFGPEGEDVAFRRVPDEATGELREAELGRPRAARGGWWLPLALPAGTGAHERLLLRLAEGTAAPDGAVRLAVSDDGAAWRLLVADELRPLAAGDGRLTLAYPSTEARQLRIGWPVSDRAAASPSAPPVLASVAVEEMPRRSHRLSLPRPDCRSYEASPTSARVACRLPLGGAGRFLRRVCFTVASTAPAGYRLLRAEDGRWEEVAGGAWRDGAGTAGALPRCLDLDLTLSAAAETLRLELYGGGPEAPSVRDASAELRGESLFFRARRPGRHTLAYGPGVAPSSSFERLPAPAAGTEPTTVEPGPEELAEVPSEGLGLPASGGPAPTGGFAETWTVAADAPEPGSLHRLALPPEVYGVAGADLADVRLIIPGLGSEMQVPYLRWRPEEPVLEAELRGAVPAPVDGGLTVLELAAANRGLPLSALVVSAPPAAGGDRRIRALYVGADDPEPGGPAGGVGGRASSPWLEWTCTAEPPLPCRFTVALEEAGSGSARTIGVEIDDRGAGPLPAVDVELWRRRDVLLFGWPAGDGPLLLGAGVPGLSAPDYRLAARREELLARPWREARLVGEQEAATGGRLAAWAIGLALVAAAVVLVLLLDRMLEGEAVRGRKGRRQRNG